ncbi:GAP family protein [Aerococcaceae bacterium DSM 111176]|nr:GAP family protein [Aerococcaceae bacterium DSM 111176]
MISLLMSTISLGLADSLNPFGISMLFVLQGMVKKPWHTLYFIFSTGVVNLVGGLLVYFGFLDIFVIGFEYINQNYQTALITVEIILAFILALLAVWEFIKPKIRAKIEVATNYQFEKDGTAIKVTSVTPKALVLIGAATTISELSTAFPYFAFLGYIFTNDYSALAVILALLFYNLLYMSPLLVLFLIYKYAHDQFDRLYVKIYALIARFSNILTPAVLAIIAAVILYHALGQLV